LTQSWGIQKYSYPKSRRAVLSGGRKGEKGGKLERLRRTEIILGELKGRNEKMVGTRHLDEERKRT